MKRVRPEDRKGECESCGFPTTVSAYNPSPMVRFERNQQGVPDNEYWQWMCEICAGTPAGVAFQYSYADRQLFAMVANIGNRILAAVAEQEA